MSLACIVFTNGCAHIWWHVSFLSDQRIGNPSVLRKVVRRASLSDRHNLCRKEYETEAIVWRGGREEADEKEKESDQENNQVVNVSLQVIYPGLNKYGEKTVLKSIFVSLFLQTVDHILFTSIFLLEISKSKFSVFHNVLSRQKKKKFTGYAY